MSFETSEFFEDALHVPHRRRNNLLFPDRSFSINFDSWCNNSINTALNYIELPRNIILPPPTFGLTRCYGAICFDVQKNPMSLLTVYEYEKQTVYQKFNYDKNQNSWKIANYGTIPSIKKIEIEQPTFTYDETDKRSTIKGFRIQMSDVVKHKQWKNVTFIDIFALNEIVFDANIHKSGEKARIMILAPNWNVPSGAEIILDGREGKSHPAAAANGEGNAAKGHNGEVGLPGGPAGHLFGAGVVFKNLDLLSISANGGKGGIGQTGGNGNFFFR